MKANSIVQTLAGILWISLILAYSGCQSPGPAFPETGAWRATLSLTDTAVLPFLASLEGDAEAGYSFNIHNAEERIKVDEIRLEGDSIFLEMPVFNSRIEARLLDSQHWEGVWRDFSRGADYAIPFAAVRTAAERFATGETAAASIAPSWAMDFSPQSEEDFYPAIGQFEQEGDRVSGTILTETGDYRYLEGVWDANGLQLSAFDGSHAFLFQANLTSDSTLEGTFYSGSHWREPFVARIDTDVSLRSPDELTYLKPGYESVDFTFPDLEGNLVSLKDSQYAGKVVIVQVLGSWCPNCMDETRLFGEWYRSYHDQGLEIIGLAFERIDDEESARTSIKKMAKRLKADYPILLAELTNSKAAASEALPMLNQVISYPTSIYIDRQGEVRQIHTGFNGPGTGDLYLRYMDTYSQLIETLLAEKGSSAS